MHLIRRVTEARAGILQLLGVALLLGIGVNLVSGWVTTAIGPTVSAWIGLVVVAGVVLAIVITQLKGLRETVSFGGVVAIYENQVVSIPRYGLAEDLARVMKAVTGENAALAKQWNEEPLVLPRVEGEAAKNHNNFDGAGATLLREALEYVYLEKLSTHLDGYFSNGPLANLVREHLRADLLPLLPDNRVLDVLSSPLEDRIALIEAQNRGGPDHHFVRITRKTMHHDGREEEVLVMASDGQVMFNRLNLTLPRGVTVERIARGHIRLDSRVLRTDLLIDFEGYGSNLDREFLDHYLGLPGKNFYGFGDSSGQLWQVDFKFVSSVKWAGVFTMQGWRLHRWAELFAETTRSAIDRDAFLSSIGWQTARTVLMSTREHHRAAPKDDSPGYESDDAPAEADSTSDG